MKTNSETSPAAPPQALLGSPPHGLWQPDAGGRFVDVFLLMKPP